MNINELVDELVNFFDADESEEEFVRNIILEAFELGYFEGQEDAEIRYLSN